MADNYKDFDAALENTVEESLEFTMMDLPHLIQDKQYVTLDI